jgi:type IV pilus assembly protein PilE
MIVVAVIAILAAIAYPSYIKYVTKTHRVAAEACLSEFSNYMERYYTTNLRYDKDLTGTNANTPPFTTMDCATPNQTGDNYTYGWAAGEPTRSTYTIVATPINAQVTRDTQCGALKIDQAGTRTIGGTGTLNQCW